MSKNKLLGLVGFIGSGKDTVADYLCSHYDFQRDSFANTLKDAVASVFGWDRSMLEGKTPESRAWREEVDVWWSTRLNIPTLTPRWVLQHWGTEVLRNAFHDDIWIASLENKLRNSTTNTVVSDVRFPNEIAAIQKSGGSIVLINRGPLPEWYVHALKVNTLSENDPSWIEHHEKLSKLKIHASETSWIGSTIDYTLHNDYSLERLYDQIDQLHTQLT